MATRFLGSAFQINIDSGDGQGVLGQQQEPEVTTLSDGRFAVVYQSDFNGVSSDPDPIAAVFNADGTASSPRYQDVFSFTDSQSEPTVAARLDGGFGAVFTNQLHADAFPDPNSSNITYVPVAADGTPGAPLAIGDFDDVPGHNNLIHPAIATLSSGRQVVAFERIFVPGVDDDIYLNVVSADGTTTDVPASQPLSVAADGRFQADPAVAAIGNTALVVYEDSFGTTVDSRNIVARLFDGATDTLGTRFTIADHASALAQPKIAALDDHRYVIVYTDLNDVSTSLDDDVFGRIYDTSGSGSLSAEFNIGRPNFGDFTPAVAVTADGGFIVSWGGLNGNDPDILARRYNSDGQAMGDLFTVSKLVDGDQVHPTVAVSGANVFFGWGDNAPRPGDASPEGVRGQMMSLTTPPDFNDNGISDILWRNDSGALAAWDIKRGGAINGSANLTFGGVAQRPDASWSTAGITDFSGDGRADILWRNTNSQLALWTMNGNSITGSAAITDSSGTLEQPDPSWSVAGVGDFNFDGKSDVLWHNAGGALAVWTMDGSVISSSALVTSGGSAVALDASWSVAGIGDFNGDGKSDVIWRNLSGELAEWQMDGSSIGGSADLTASGTAVRPDASWSIAGVGDFNADGDADLLWRNTNGSLVEWQMDGSTIASSGMVTARGGAVVSPDASWHVVEIGDFNGDARTDILWRNDNGALAEWMMNGNSIVSSFAPSSGGVTVSPDASWHSQAKPTDFA